VVGMPIAGLGGIDARTSEDDWVVTGVHRGEPFRRYVSSNATMDNAISLVAQILKLTPDGLEWITAKRRHEVERCIRLDGDWLRSRTI
jgi:hypothetical protein